MPTPFLNVFEAGIVLKEFTVEIATMYLQAFSTELFQA